MLHFRSSFRLVTAASLSISSSPQHAKPGMINVASKKCAVPGEPCGKVIT